MIVRLFLGTICSRLVGCSARLTDVTFLKGIEVLRVAFVGEPVISKNRRIVVSECSAFFKQLSLRVCESKERKL